MAKFWNVFLMADTSPELPFPPKMCLTSRERTPGLAKKLLDGLYVIEGTNVGSGQYAVKKLADCREDFDKKLDQRDGATSADTIPLSDADIPFTAANEVTEWADVVRLLKEKGLPVEYEEIERLKPPPSEERLEKARERDYATAKKLREQEVAAMAAFAAKNPRQRRPKPTDDYLRAIFRHDELANAYKSQSVSMEELLLTTFERTIAAHGSFLNGERTVENVCVGLIADTTERVFADLYTGRISATSGFLPRCTIEYGTKKHLEWQPIDLERAMAAVKEITTRLDGLPKSTIRPGPRFVPPETTAARELRREFLLWLSNQNPVLIPELDTHFRRDVLIRVIMSGRGEIDTVHVERGSRGRSTNSRFGNIYIHRIRRRQLDGWRVGFCGRSTRTHRRRSRIVTLRPHCMSVEGAWAVTTITTERGTHCSKLERL